MIEIIFTIENITVNIISINLHFQRNTIPTELFFPCSCISYENMTSYVQANDHLSKMYEP